MPLSEVPYLPSVSPQVTRPAHVKSGVRAPPQAEVGLEEIVGPENPSFKQLEHREVDTEVRKSGSHPSFKWFERRAVGI